jgi:hypothetical protein
MLNLGKVNKLVALYLGGNVTELDIHYITDSIYELKIKYEGNWFYLYEYQVRINVLEETIEHCYHTCHCQIERIKLPQEKEFEEKILKTLKKTHLIQGQNGKIMNKKMSIMTNL